MKVIKQSKYRRFRIVVICGCIPLLALAIFGCHPPGPRYGNDIIAIQAIDGIEARLSQFSIRDLSIELANNGTGDAAPFDLEIAIGSTGGELDLTGQPIDVESIAVGARLP
jgi:hypothetical protein